ncbi:MAG: hypothetical protein AAGJ83_15480 [Planctomycetota bacterium]
MLHRFFLAATLLLVLAAVPANAALVTFTAQSAGNYASIVGSPSFDATRALVANQENFVASSYIVFDISSLADPAIALELATNTGPDVGRTSNVTIEFNAFSGNLNDLTSGALSLSDLESPRDYGSFFSLATQPDNEAFTVELNAAAIDDFNASSGLFVITVTQPTATPTSGLLGDLTANDFTLSALTAIPEPSSCVALAGLTAVILPRRRRR